MAKDDMYTDVNLQCIIKALNNLWSLVMGKYIDRTGMIYGKLTVLGRQGHNSCKKTSWLCLCLCGKKTVVDACSLATGNTTSCGCYKPSFKHGGWKKSSYNTWRAMMRRCNNPKDKDYVKYGAMGISVCEKWHDYLAFESDMGEPVGAETLDRIDTYGNYEPSNCRWASVATQNRNLRVRKSSKSGHTGVYPVDGKWIAAITANKRKYYSKVFKSLEEAIQARKQLEQTYWV